ncbi:MAG TPA: HIT family protein [Candidatus Binatia bacterium]|nr:HIT family protein [Candidatus Binatia bacterium]
MSSVEECPFCNIGTRALKSNQLAQAFLSNPHKTPGHFLVTPIRHVEKPWELTKEEVLCIFDLVNNIEQKLIGSVCDGCDIRQNYRPFLQQDRTKIDHIHYHIIPRDNEDHIFQVSETHDNELWQDLTQTEKDKFTKLLA